MDSSRWVGEVSAPRPGGDGIHAVVLNAEARPDGVRVFTAMRAAEIEHVGARATAWIAAQLDLEIVELWVVQSSAGASHCYSLCVWYRRREP